MYVRWYDGNLGGDLFLARVQYVVNAKNYSL